MVERNLSNKKVVQLLKATVVNDGQDIYRFVNMDIVLAKRKQLFYAILDDSFSCSNK